MNLICSTDTTLDLMLEEIKFKCDWTIKNYVNETKTVTDLCG